MNKLNIQKTVIPDQTFRTPEEWLDAIGARSEYRHDGSSIAADVRVDEWIFINKLFRNIPVFSRKTWAEFVSHRKQLIKS